MPSSRNVRVVSIQSVFFKWIYFTILPSYYFYFFLVTLVVKKFVIKFCFFWKVGNYADSYWFLYSNKKLISYVRGSSYVSNVTHFYNQMRGTQSKFEVKLSNRFRIKWRTQDFRGQFRIRESKHQFSNVRFKTHQWPRMSDSFEGHASMKRKYGAWPVIFNSF